MEYALDENQLDAIEDILKSDFLDMGVDCVLLIDLAGNILSNVDNGKVNLDIYSLAALAAGNFGAVSAMAGMVGEDDFSLQFHKGEKQSIHFSRISDDFLLVTLFGKDTSLGFLRLRITEAIKKFEDILKG